IIARTRIYSLSLHDALPIWGKVMDRMFRGLAFWTGIFTVMFFVGDMNKTALLFLVQTVFFLTLSYLNLSERMYMYLFGAYLTVRSEEHTSELQSRFDIVCRL